MSSPFCAAPKRADARRNYDKVVAAAWDAFADRGTSTSLEEIARRAEVGIGTLYRNFPNRQALLEAVYVDEVDDLCRSAAELDGLAPWDAFTAWVDRLVGYLATKQALAQELLEYFDRDAPLFKACRASLFTAGQPLLDRAQQAHAVRADTNLSEIIQIVGGIAQDPRHRARSDQAHAPDRARRSALPAGQGLAPPDGQPEAAHPGLGARRSRARSAWRRRCARLLGEGLPGGRRCSRGHDHARVRDVLGTREATTGIEPV